MTEQNPVDGRSIGKIYDQQADIYANFSDKRFAWLYLERPAFDRYISDLYLSQTRVLDIGCGTGVVARHLISQGVLPSNIVGIDPSQRQLGEARVATPGVRFIEAPADEFDLPAGSIDLVTTNTVLHHLNSEELERMLDRIYTVLAPGGCYFFVDVDPDHNLEGRDPKNTNRWTSVRTPWGTEVPFFNRDPHDLVDALDRHGFDKVSGWTQKVAPEGMEDLENYINYSSRPSRMAARYQKVPEITKILRANNVMIPNLVETPEQAIQHELVGRYFDAWRNQSVETILDLFSTDAVYDEKPGEIAALQGIKEIEEYWKSNPISQRNIRVGYDIAGFSEDASMWVEFSGEFDAKDKHVAISGIIKFTIDPMTRRIVELREYFTTDKTPLFANS